MTASVRVLEADFADPLHRSGILGIIDSYARDPVGGGEPLTEGVRETLVGALQAHPTTRIFLAFSGDRPVGAAICFVGFSTFAARPLLNVHDLAVLPDWRGRGVGRALLSAAEEHAREEGCCKLTLEVQDDNLPARGLYESFGFEDFVIGTSAPTRFLTKPLNP